jgi:hypothetical protein
LNQLVDKIRPSADEIDRLRAKKHEIISYIQQNANKTNFTIAESHGYGSLDTNTIVTGLNDLDIDIIINMHGINIADAINQMKNLLSTKYYSVYIKSSERGIINFNTGYSVDLRLLPNTITISKHYEINHPCPRFVMLLKWIRNKKYHSPQLIDSFILYSLGKKCYDNLYNSYKRNPTLDEMFAHFPKISGNDVRFDFANLISNLSTQRDNNGNYYWI